MWDYDEFIAKAKLYFQRGSDAGEVKADDGSAVWLLLGLEFLLRAPLAKVHPTLLAVPEGPSILHAAGFQREGSFPRSIATKAVIDRLIYIDPNFGQDRGKDALFLADVRNGELHISMAAVANAPIEVWFPKLLAVVEAVCSHLAIPVEDILPGNVIGHARDLASRLDRELQKRVRQAIADSKYHAEHLTALEIETRKAASVAVPMRMGEMKLDLDCPACQNKTATVVSSPGASGTSVYDEEDDVIRHSVTFLAKSLSCRVCGLDLDSTAAVMAAGIDRLFVTSREEDRYEGWEDRITYEEAMRVIGADEGDYMND